MSWLTRGLAVHPVLTVGAERDGSPYRDHAGSIIVQLRRAVSRARQSDAVGCTNTGLSSRAAYSGASLAFRDRLVIEWNKTQQRQTFADQKRVYCG